MRTFLVKLILSLTRPEAAPSPKKRNLPFKTSLYLSLLNRLASYYGKYSSEDTFFVGDSMTVKCSFRDPDFEKELQRMNISLKPHMSVVKIENTKPSRKGHIFSYKPYYRFFNFVNLTTVSGFGKEISIDRTFGLDVYGTFTSRVRTGSEKDPISVCSVHIALPKNSPLSNPKPSSLPKQAAPVTSNKPVIKTPPTFKSEPKPVIPEKIPKHNERNGSGGSYEKRNDEPKTPVQKPASAPGMFSKEVPQRPAIKESQPVSKPVTQNGPTNPIIPEVKPEPKSDTIVDKPKTVVVRGIEIDDDF